MKRVFSRDEAISFINADNRNVRPARIIEGLETLGFKNIEKVGRGSKLFFTCEQSDDTNEQCYYIFKDICKNEYGYDKKFNYDKLLEIIDFHIRNKSYKTLAEIADELGEISDVHIGRHRKRLSKIAKENNKMQIVKATKECDAKTFARVIDSEEIEDITKIYEDVILQSYHKSIKEIYEENEISARVELSIFVKYSQQEYEIIRRDKKNNDNFILMKDLLIKDGYKYIASYPLWWDVATTKPYINPHFKRKIYEVNLKCHGFDYVFYRRIYEITQELREDNELLEVINKAINHKKTLN